MAEKPVIRPATSADQRVIVGLVRSVGINPLGLHWRRFLVAELDGQIVGIGQVKQHRDGSHELASIATVPEWRGRGVARHLIDALLAREAGPLYLTCRAPMEPFYTKFGFRCLEDVSVMPRYFRLVFGVLRLAAILTGRASGIIMARPAAGLA